MEISLKSLFELVIVVTTVKLIVSRYSPPIQESVQALICLIIGTTISLFLEPNSRGLVTGIIGSGFAFYGGDLVSAFKSVNSNLKDLKNNNSTK